MEGVLLCGTDQEEDARYCRFCGHQLKKSKLPLTVLIAVIAVIGLAAVGIQLAGSHGAEAQTAPPEQSQVQNQTQSQTQSEQQIVAQTEEKSEPTYEIFYENCTWQEAFDRCVEMGGKLVTFETEEEYQKVLSRLDINKIYYIGAGRAENSTSYCWVNADRTLSGETLNGSSHWLDGEPSLSEGDVGEYYVNLFYLKKQGKWVWNDIPNDTIAVAPNYKDKIGYICEFE